MSYYIHEKSVKNLFTKSHASGRSKLHEEDEEKRWITLGEALAEAITDALVTGDSEIDAGSLEELSETTSTSELSSSSAPPS
ncbi:hypothetical protein EV426DRAFT_704415 [Tirmania nivea]|nr:hypothetical protein EV426DRAFT_704415 [Tirmania nivea]